MALSPASNTGLCGRTSLFSHEERLNIGFCNAGIRSVVRRNGLVIRASASKSHSVDMINGKKVNGVHLGEATNLARISSGMVKDVPEMNSYLMGRFVEDRFIYRQTFIIRSYEIGPDKTATMETLMNLLQETALNHVRNSGLAGSGFGSTREMSLRKLIWVVTRINIQVEKYSSWGDIIEIDTWVDAAGKNGMRRDWIIRDFKTQQVITRATSTWVIMNRVTRRLTKMPDQVRDEVTPFFTNRLSSAIVDNDSRKIDRLDDETSERIRADLEPRWSDMDANQHVNNVKYIGWILESVPIKVLEDYYLASMTLEYRRECRQSDLLQSLTSIKEKVTDCTESSSRKTLESIHLLRMQDNKDEIVRARSVWKCKQNLH
uniref:Acyl-[acyl-carrier-protein] hydrolase n=1 Tax=Kalanchoe fedtschenkoi TaxID=63787 RepID=A0A7N0UJA2_KALFE